MSVLVLPLMKGDHGLSVPVCHPPMAMVCVCLSSSTPDPEVGSSILFIYIRCCFYCHLVCVCVWWEQHLIHLNKVLLLLPHSMITGPCTGASGIRYQSTDREQVCCMKELDLARSGDLACLPINSPCVRLARLIDPSLAHHASVPAVCKAAVKRFQVFKKV